MKESVEIILLEGISRYILSVESKITTDCNIIKLSYTIIYLGRFEGVWEGSRL